MSDNSLQNLKFVTTIYKNQKKVLIMKYQVLRAYCGTSLSPEMYIKQTFNQS